VNKALLGDAYRVTFHDVEFTDGGTDKLRITIADGDSPEIFNGDALFIGQGNSSRFSKTEGGTTNQIDVVDIAFPSTVSFEVDETTVRLLVDGKSVAEAAFSRANSGVLVPKVQLADRGGGDTVSIGDVSVERL